MSFDPGAKMGWCVIQKELDITMPIYIEGGTHEFKYPTPSQQKKGKAKATKWLDIQEWLAHSLDHYKPDKVVTESVRRHSSTLASHSYGFIRYSIEVECAKREIPFIALEVGNWKKICTGNGSADKDLVMKVMGEMYNIPKFDTDDHSDSLGIAHASTIDYIEEPKPAKKPKKSKQPSPKS
jgi:Holliday junction resolvasome RuvABC endonuclease subunit